MRSTGSRYSDSVAVAHELRCSVASGIFPDQRLNSCLLHWQADSYPLRHQGSLGECGLRKEPRLDSLPAFRILEPVAPYPLPFCCHRDKFPG